MAFNRGRLQFKARRWSPQPIFKAGVIGVLRPIQIDRNRPLLETDFYSRQAFRNQKEIGPWSKPISIQVRCLFKHIRYNFFRKYVFSKKRFVFSVPSEVEQSLGGRGHAEIGPGEEVELRHRPRLVRLQILQVEAADQIVIAPDVLRDEVDLRMQNAFHVLLACKHNCLIHFLQCTKFNNAASWKDH